MCDCLDSLLGSSSPSASDGGPSGTDGGGCADGGSPPCCVPIQSIKIVSVKFLSDHALLKDYTTNWNDGGARFPKPEWTPAHQYPVSHTMDKEVQIEVEYAVLPPNACPETGDLRGEGPGGIVFEKTGITFKPGVDKQTLASGTKRLPQKIQELSFAIQWSTKGTSVSISPAQTTNTVFVTMGTPTTPRWPGVTLKRMRHAVSATGAANSLDPHKIVKHVLSKWSSFNLNQVYDNEWELADDATDPVTGDLIGADCQTIVRHTESVIKMVGCPGKSEFIVVWAKVPTPAHGEENLAYEPNVVSPPQWYNNFRPPNPSRTRWLAGLVDGDGGLNKYEACLRFTYPEGSTASGARKYYAGGVGEKINVNAVIRVFTSMSWINIDTLETKAVIHTY